MKASTIVEALTSSISKYTTRFSSEISSIESMQANEDGYIYVTTTNKHRLKSGNAIIVNGALRKTPLISIGDGLLITKTPHDLTTNYQKEVTIIGTEYNDGTFSVVNIPDKYSCEFDQLLVIEEESNTGYLLEDVSYSFNGEFVVEVIDDYNFRYKNKYNVQGEAGGNPQIYTKPMIAAIAMPEDLSKIYNDQSTESRVVGYVHVEPVESDKDRFINVDTNYVNNDGLDFRQRLINKFSIYVVVPTEDDYTAAQAKDDMVDLSKAIFKCLLRKRLPSPYSQGYYSNITFVEHGSVDYLGAYYVHVFTFECITDLTIDDVWTDDPNVAFRTLKANSVRGLLVESELKP